ncbi:MAG: NUDIX domain-containing protein [Calditrichia bacterium]
MSSAKEWFDILSPEGKVVGKATRDEVHGNPDLLHAVVHVHIINQHGDLFVQKRASNKDMFPDYWDTAVGGHVNSGETIQDTHFTARHLRSWVSSVINSILHLITSCAIRKRANW